MKKLVINDTEGIFRKLLKNQTEQNKKNKNEKTDVTKKSYVLKIVHNKRLKK